jgi:hypothetical protein
MPQDATTRRPGTEQKQYVTLLAVQQEVRLTRGTLKKYLAFLGIEPICFHIGTRSLHISREAMAQVKQLKENPGVLTHLRSAAVPGASD